MQAPREYRADPVGPWYTFCICHISNWVSGQTCQKHLSSWMKSKLWWSHRTQYYTSTKRNRHCQLCLYFTKGRPFCARVKLPIPWQTQLWGCRPTKRRRWIVTFRRSRILLENLYFPPTKMHGLDYNSWPSGVHGVQSNNTECSANGAAHSYCIYRRVQTNEHHLFFRQRFRMTCVYFALYQCTYSIQFNLPAQILVLCNYQIPAPAFIAKKFSYRLETRRQLRISL